MKSCSRNIINRNPIHSTNMANRTKTQRNRKNHVVWKVNEFGRIVEQYNITDAGRKMVENMPNGSDKKEKWVKGGSYQMVIRPFLDRCIRVDDCGNVVTHGGYYWMSIPPPAIVSRIHSKDVQDKKIQQVINENKEKTDEISQLNTIIQKANREIFTATTAMKSVEVEREDAIKKVIEMKDTIDKKNMEIEYLKNIVSEMQSSIETRENIISKFYENLESFNLNIKKFSSGFVNASK